MRFTWKRSCGFMPRSELFRSFVWRPRCKIEPSRLCGVSIGGFRPSEYGVAIATCSSCRRNTRRRFFFAEVQRDTSRAKPLI
jgi:hypothetical protein